MIDEQTEKTKPRSSFWKELPILLGVAVLVAFLVRAFVMQTFWIPSQSMEHTLNIHDHVLVNKLVYDFRSPRRGEILVFEAPERWSTSEGEDFIKRVLGVGGDHITCCDAQGRIMVNGKPLDEPYVYTDASGIQDKPADQDFDVTIPAGRLWVMGDHRSASADSLQHWKGSKDIQESTISENAVVGRAFTLFWPFSRARWLPVPGTFDAVPDGPR
ncbi:signal peptidase I [Micromonospora sp. NPDC049282]|uniref:signal peptidase I n=1 Tax=Micromonospora sp. NPDC049282 TaxID=3364269 RepID=UPI00371BACCF